MNSEYTLYVLLAGIAFGSALLAVVMQWLKADDVAARVEAGLRSKMMHREAMASEGVGTLPPFGMPIPAEPEREAEPSKPAAERADAATKPALIAEDESALARLCLGWGAGGTVVGIASGAAIGGFIGALLGAVVLSAASIGVVVVVVLMIDHAKLAAWREANKGV